jgi:hypothetical protein
MIQRRVDDTALRANKKNVARGWRIHANGGAG